MSSGARFEIRHSEMAALSKSNLIVSRPDSDEVDLGVLPHVSNVEAGREPTVWERPTTPSPSSGGSGSGQRNQEPSPTRIAAIFCLTEPR